MSELVTRLQSVRISDKASVRISDKASVRISDKTAQCQILWQDQCQN